MNQQTNYLDGFLKNQPSKVFVTSDTFFGRKKSATARGFETTEEMDETMIQLWNQKVTKDDIVIHLGNFAWTVNDVFRVYSKLNGQILFMIGEHDQSLLEIEEDEAQSTELIVLEDQIIMRRGVTLCHWPLEAWPGKKQNMFHFHGHLASNVKSDVSKIQRLNVCCDNWGLAPIEINDTLELLKDFQQ
jgi:calcineurin-like phosphoesterase family protein